MKKALPSFPIIFCSLVCALFILCRYSLAQTHGEWTWMKGDSALGGPGIYGTQGVAAPANLPGGRYESGGMTDSAGNFWLYGGSGYDHNANLGLLDDLWKYDPTTNNWAFMKGDSATGQSAVYGTQGIPSPANHPGPRYAFVTWNQSNGSLWLIGGDGYNDLWRYDIATNEWTWMTGTNSGSAVGVYGTKGVAAAGNTPGQRTEVTASWVDASGNLWLFGGGGYAASTAYGYLNDLWMYNPGTNLWMWVSGDNFVNATGVYGTLGIPSPTNKPGGRYAYCSWADLQGNLWIFSGYNSNYYNDLWRFDITTWQWTWMGGSNVAVSGNSGGLYVAKCSSDSLHIPSRRFENKANWTDTLGNFWTYGGFDIISDLWSYSPSSHKWTWVSGDTVSNSITSVWGTQGVSSPLNHPGGRFGAPAFRNTDGSLWIFGGAYGSIERDNALWRYIPCDTCGGCLQSQPVAVFTCSDTVFCSEAGQCISFFDHSTGNPTSWKWIFNGASPDTSNIQNPTNICYNTPGTYPVTLIVANSAGRDTLTVASLIIYSNPPPPPTITLGSGDTLFSSHGSSYQWYLNGSLIAGATDSFYVATQGGTYAVQITDGLGCNSLSGGFIITGVSPFSLEDGKGIRIYPNPVSQELLISFFGDKPELTVVDMLGQIIDIRPIEKSSTNYSVNVSDFRDGSYLLQIKTSKYIINKRFTVMH